MRNKINGINLYNTDSTIQVPQKLITPPRKVYIPTTKNMEAIDLKPKYVEFFRHKNSTIFVSLLTRSKHLYVGFDSPSDVYNFLPHISAMNSEVVVNQVELTIPIGLYSLPVHNLNLVKFSQHSFSLIYNVHRNNHVVTLINRELTELM